jgi:UDP-N-acetylmuramoylalanine--D-glutamate ligase
MSKIIVLGGGESGVGAALLAKSKGFDVFLSDQGTLKEAFKKTLSDHNIRFEEGQHTLEEILIGDEVIISPGIPEKNEVVKKIKEQYIPLISEIEFAVRYTSAKIIAITGSNGKTTTTLLTYHLLKEAGYQVGLAGNIGQSFAKQVLENNHEYYVLEISSFQLDRCISFSPDVAILLNITPDHLDRYEYKFENYIASKFRIFQNADLAKTCIFWEDDEVIQANKKGIPPSHFSTISSKNNHSDAFISADKISLKTGEVDLATAPIQGPHNAINMSAAILAAQSVGISLDKIKELLPTFHNAPHRLEPCGLSNGVHFVNDSKATNVDAVYYALNSFNQRIILMRG